MGVSWKSGRIRGREREHTIGEPVDAAAAAIQEQTLAISAGVRSWMLVGMGIEPVPVVIVGLFMDAGSGEQVAMVKVTVRGPRAMVGDESMLLACRGPTLR